MIQFSATAKADPDVLLRAVVTVFDEYQRDGLKPGAEKWIGDTRRFRPRMIAEVQDCWHELTGEEAIFPWHDDYVTQVWTAFRKTGQSEEVRLRKELGIGITKDLLTDMELAT